VRDNTRLSCYQKTKQKSEYTFGKTFTHCVRQPNIVGHIKQICKDKYGRLTSKMMLYDTATNAEWLK